MERIASSEVFHRSARLRELLLYVGHRSIDGRMDELTESQIGTHVFGRPEGFNPGDDSIVRVTARQLRTRLAEYFAGQGREEQLLLEIPKGSYVAHFALRPSLPPPAPELRPAEPVGPTKMQTLWWVFAAIAAIAAGLALWLSRSAFVSPPMTLSRAVLTANEARTMVVLADTGLVIAQKISSGAPGVEQYASGEYLQTQSQAFERAGVAELAKHLRITQHTGIADAATYGRILRGNPDLMDRVLLRHARSVSSRDFQTDNAILIGGSGANPWVNVFTGRMNFLLSYDAPTATTFFTNRTPAPGEAQRYDSAYGGTVGYGQVMLLKHGRTPNRVLVLSGTSMEAKEAAGDFITDPAAYQRLLALLKRDSLRDIDYLEILLKTRKLAGSSQDWTIIAHRTGG